MRITDEVDIFRIFQLDSNNFEYKKFLKNYSYVLTEFSYSNFEECTDLLLFSSFINTISEFQKDTFSYCDILGEDLASYIFVKYNQVVDTPKELLQISDILFINTVMCEQKLNRYYSRKITQELIVTMFENVYHAEKVLATSAKQKLRH